MNARRFTVRLYERSGLLWRPRTSTDLNLDPRDDDRLREVLEERVKDHKRTLRLDLAKWSIRVTDQRRREVARVEIDASGRSVVKRP